MLAATVVASGCHRAAIAQNPPTTDAGPPPSPDAGVALSWAKRLSAKVAVLCEAQNRNPVFRKCPHWSISAPTSCDAVSPGAGPGPQAFDPCVCVCDLCAYDDDCTAHAEGRCVKLSQNIGWGVEANTCAYPEDLCGLQGHTCAALGQFCAAPNGVPECVTASPPSRR